MVTYSMTCQSHSKQTTRTHGKQEQRAVTKFFFILTLWSPLLSYGYNSYKASCARSD